MQKAQARPSRFQQAAKTFRKSRSLLLLAMPGVLFLLVFNYAPMFGSILAFKDFRYDLGILRSPWVGLNNFRFFFESQAAWTVTRNTLLMNLLFIVVGTAVAIVLALMLAELSRRSVKIFQTVLFFPFFISWVVVGYAVYALLATDYGAVNAILRSQGLEEIYWYGETAYWVGLLLLIYLWKNVGYTALLYYTGLLGIDASYYEAAQIDGASRWQQITRITLPLLLPLITMMTLLSVGKIFYSDFGLFFFVTRDSTALYKVADVIDTYVYRALRKSGDLTMSAAAGLYQSVMGFVLILLSNWLVKRMDPENAIF